MIFKALLLGWVILFSAILSIVISLCGTILIRKGGLDNVDVVNLVMAEVCVFAVVLPIMFTLLES